MKELEVLNEAECLELLASAELGRFSVLVDGYPMVFPVNYVLDGDVVTFRTFPGTKYEASLHSNVAFEVDHVDLDGRSAWSVLVLGSVDRRGLTEQERERVRHLEIHPFPSEDMPVWARIVPDRITGRRLKTADDSLPFDARGYL